jgi:tetratricopeptide (TPR) repeat protein
MPFFFASVALALPLELQLSPGARVELLPPQVSGRVELVVHQNQIDLAPQVGWTVGTGIHRARAWELGGDQVVSLVLESPENAIDAVQTASGVELHVVPRSTPLPALVPGRSAVAALAGELDTTACSEPSLSLKPLSGSDGRWSVDLVSSPPPLPMWSAAEPAVVTWSEVWDTQRTMSRARTASALERTAYRLGALHRGLGQHREAAYYFERAARADGGQAAVAWFQAARSRLEVREWEGARRAARAAADAGGAPEMALLALLWAEVHDDGGDVLGMGRALTSGGLTAEHERLVGVALTRGGCAAEAVPLFARSLRRAVGMEQALAQLLLADAQLLAGDVDTARRGYAAVDADRLAVPLRHILRTRTRHLALLEMPVERWGSMLPDLERAARIPGEAGDENLHLIAQVSERLGFERESVEALALLVRRRPALASGAVGAALSASWSVRSARLLAASRPVDALALHRAIPAEVLVAHLLGSEPLHAVAHEYAHAGLPGQALVTFREAVEVETRLKQASAPTILELARLYVQTGANTDAIDAVGWLRRHGWKDEDELVLLEGRASLAAGRTKRGRQLLTSLNASATHGTEARTRLALLDAAEGRCAEAKAPLESATAQPVAGISAEWVQEAHTRCLIALGLEGEAAKAAKIAAGLVSHQDVRGWATTRAARLAQETGGRAEPMVAEAASTGDGIWGALAREEAAQKAWGARLAGRRLP